MEAGQRYRQYMALVEGLLTAQMRVSGMSEVKIVAAVVSGSCFCVWRASDAPAAVAAADRCRDRLR